jgi:hypothetical protein
MVLDELFQVGVHELKDSILDQFTVIGPRIVKVKDFNNIVGIFDIGQDFILTRDFRAYLFYPFEGHAALTHLIIGFKDES